MKVNNVDNFISGLKDFYFRTFKDFFLDTTEEEFDKIFDKVIDLRKE